MYKPVLFFLSLVFGLLLVSISLDPRPLMPQPQEALVQGVREPGQLFTEAEYKRLKLAFSSFDLAAGLTRQDFESMPAGREYTFYSLLGVFWLVLGLKTLGKPKKFS